MHRLALAVLLICLLLVAGCAAPGSGAPSGSSTTPPVDPVAARAFSHAFAADLIADNSDALYGRMNKGFRDGNRKQDMPELLKRIYAQYGRPLEAEFKMEESGYAADPTGKMHTRTYWYSGRTALSPKGQRFLKIDVISDGGRPAVLQFSIVEFTVNGPPDALK